MKERRRRGRKRVSDREKKGKRQTTRVSEKKQENRERETESLEREKEPPCYILTPMPTIGTKSCNSVPYFTPVGGVIKPFGNAVI